MKRLFFVVAALSMAFSQNAYAKAVRLRESTVGQGLAISRCAVVRGSAASTGRHLMAAQVSAVEAAASLRDVLGVDVSAASLAVRRDDTDAFGRRHVRLRQLYRGIEVDGRELIVHFGADGRVYEVNGDWLDGLALDVSPAVRVPGAELVVYCKGDDAAAARLAWKVRKGGKLVFTDAKTGEKLHVRQAGPHHATKNDDDGDDDDYTPLDPDELILRACTLAFPEGTETKIQGFLPRQHGGFPVEVGAIASTDGNVYLTTTNRYGIEIGVLDGIATPQNRAAAVAAEKARDDAWFQSFTSNAYWTAYSTNEDEDMPNALAIVCNISLVLDYYMDVFGRRSYDGAGGRIAAWRFWQDDSDDIDTGYLNAFWMSLGDNAANTQGCFFFGYDLTGKESETSLDTCAHELTHGVTSWSANLMYEGEPGALNESFSDIIGVSAEFALQPRADDLENPAPGEADWLVDEDSGTILRSFANPQLYNQPSRYKGLRWVDVADTSEDNDHGGVHDNSGVQNHFFYLLSEGGKGRNDGVEYDLAGIGVEKAVQIAYLALTGYCVPGTDYSTIADCWDSAARDLVESGVLTAADHAALAPAWSAVLSKPPDASCGEIVYADWSGAFVKAGAPNSRGVSRIKAEIHFEDGDVARISGKAENGVFSTEKRDIGEIEISLGMDAAFISIGGDTLDVERVSPLVADLEDLDGLRVGVAFEAECELEDDGTDDVDYLRWSAKKLPYGVKVAGKTGKISGVPKKAGRGEATIQASCKFRAPGQRRAQTAKVARKAKWEVAPLDAWAYGKFAGDNMRVTVGKAGRVSGYVIAGGRKIRIAAKSFEYFYNGAYYASGDVRGGRFSATMTESGLHCTVIIGDETLSFLAPKVK